MWVRCVGLRLPESSFKMTRLPIRISLFDNIIILLSLYVILSIRDQIKNYVSNFLETSENVAAMLLSLNGLLWKRCGLQIYMFFNM